VLIGQQRCRLIDRALWISVINRGKRRPPARSFITLYAAVESRVTKLEVMSRSAYFVSAPTMRFLRALEQLRLLAAPQRRRIAAAVHAEIAPFVANPDADALSRAARAAQDERWRLISNGAGDMADVRFASIVVAEQWVLARLEIGRSAAVIEALAEKRRNAIEDFIRANLPGGTGEIVQLSARASPRDEPAGSSQTAA
jgi:hypothetical protein